MTGPLYTWPDGERRPYPPAGEPSNDPRFRTRACGRDCWPDGPCYCSPPPAPPARTHIAGIDVTIGDVLLRQRCAWCGYLLIDYDLSRVMVPTGQEGSGPGAWPVGGLVRVDGFASYVVEHEDGAPLPIDSCTRETPA